jgi:hypothetical protein
MKRKKRDQRLITVLRIAWGFILLVFFVKVFVMPLYNPYHEDDGQPANQQNQQPIAVTANQNSQGNTAVEKTTAEKTTDELKDKLKVYSQDKTHYTLWSRDEAIRFALERVDNSINYLFVAAAALLGLIAKFIIDPLTDEKRLRLLKSPTVQILIRHAAIGCVISISYGFMGYMFFADLGDTERFSIYDQIGAATLCQAVSFVLAAALMLSALALIVKEHLERGG